MEHLWRNVRLLATTIVLFVLVVGLIALPRHWPPDASAQWTAVGSLATLGILMTSVGGFAGLLMISAQTATQAKQNRSQFAPYLRVDLALDTNGGTWHAPDVESEYRFDWSAFNPGQEEPESPLSQWTTAGDGIDLCLWLRNKQTSPGGTAINVAIEMEFVVVDTAGSVSPPFEYVVRVHYLEPDRLIRYRLATVDPAIPYLRGEIRSVQYLDHFERPLAFAYGSGAFERANGTLVNFRKWFRE